MVEPGVVVETTIPARLCQDGLALAKQCLVVKDACDVAARGKEVGRLRTDAKARKTLQHVHESGAAVYRNKPQSVQDVVGCSAASLRTVKSKSSSITFAVLVSLPCYVNVFRNVTMETVIVVILFSSHYHVPYKVNYVLMYVFNVLMCLMCLVFQCFNVLVYF